MPKRLPKTASQKIFSSITNAVLIVKALKKKKIKKGISAKSKDILYWAEESEINNRKKAVWCRIIGKARIFQSLAYAYNQGKSDTEKQNNSVNWIYGVNILTAIIIHRNFRLWKHYSSIAPVFFPITEAKRIGRIN